MLEAGIAATLYCLEVEVMSRIVQLTDTCNDLCCKNGRHFEFLLNFSNAFDFKYNSHFGLIVYVTSRHCIFNQILAKMLKLW